MRSNRPIPGHALLYEGHQDLYAIDPETDNYIRPGPGGCQCGAQPPEWPVSVTATKKWHRQHKAELRAASDA